MFQLNRPTLEEIERGIANARHLPIASPGLLALNGGPVSPSCQGFAHDLSRSDLGAGHATFVDARHAMQSWKHFDIGWVSIANPAVQIADGEIVAVLAHTAGIWSLNYSKVVETIDTPTHYGFLYATTAMHVEDGQERFLIEFDEEHGTVTYLIEAFSKPRHLLAKLAYPFTRTMQHRFARDSHARMRSAVAADRLP